MEIINTSKRLPVTMLKEIIKLNDALTELDGLINKEAELIHRQEQIAKINALKSRVAKEIEHVQTAERESEYRFNKGRIFSGVAGFAIDSFIGVISNNENPFLLGAKSFSEELDKEADFGKVLIALKESSKLEDMEVIAISHLAREYKKTESSIISIIKGNGYLLLTPEELWESLHGLEEDIMEDKYKSEREQNKVLLNYAKKRK